MKTASYFGQLNEKFGRNLNFFCYDIVKVASFIRLEEFYFKLYQDYKYALAFLIS